MIPLRLSSLIALTLILLAPLLHGCSGGCEAPWSAAKARRANVGGSVTLGLPLAPPTGDPLAATDPYTQDLLGLMFPTLIKVGGEGEEPILPSLATRWEVGEDGLTVTFHLSEALRWSDGEPLTSADVAFSWRAQVSEEVGWVGAAAEAAIASVATPDPLTAVFTLKNPTPEPLMTCGLGPILPAHVLEKVPFTAWADRDFWRRAVSGGPFELYRHKDDALTLRPNGKWPEDARPSLGQLTFRIFDGEGALVDAATRGEVDFVAGVPLDRAGELSADAGWRLFGVDDYTVDFIAWNTGRAPFDDARVRQALTLALDRDAIVARALGGYGRPGVGPLHSRLWAYDPSVPRWPFDREKAAEILAGAGWMDADGDGWLDRAGQRLSISLLVNEESPLRAKYAGLVRDQLRAVGVHVVVRSLPISQLTRLALDHEFDAVISTWRGGPRVDLSMLHSKAIDGGYNYGAFSDPGLDRILDEVAVVDRERGIRLWAQAQQILHDAEPYTVLAERQRVDAVRGRLRGVKGTAEPLRDVDQWWLPAEAIPAAPHDEGEDGGGLPGAAPDDAPPGEDDAPEGGGAGDGAGGGAATQAADGAGGEAPPEGGDASPHGDAAP